MIGFLFWPVRKIFSSIARGWEHVPEKATVSLELGKGIRDKVVSSASLELEKRGPLVEARPKKVSTVIAGVGKYVPEKIITSASIEERLELERKFSMPKGTIEQITGVRERRHITGEQYSSDMALKASQMALEQAGVSADELDVIIFASASQEIGEPATANILQDKLEAWNAHVLDAKNACNSFLNALDIMDAFIQTGRCRGGLVAAGEVLSPVINWNIESPEDLELGFAGFTLGDGGGAMVLKASDDEERGIRGSYFASDGSTWELATIMGGGTRFPHDDSRNYFTSDSIRIARLAMRNIPTAIKTGLQRAGWGVEDVKLLVPHQVTQDLIERISRMCGFPPEKSIITLTKYGNTAAASIPMALAEAIETGRAHKGDNVLLVGGASGWSAAVIAVVL